MSGPPQFSLGFLFRLVMNITFALAVVVAFYKESPEIRAWLFAGVIGATAIALMLNFNRRAATMEVYVLIVIGIVISFMSLSDFVVLFLFTLVLLAVREWYSRLAKYFAPVDDLPAEPEIRDQPLERQRRTPEK